jgi:hypothetical protein
MARATVLGLCLAALLAAGGGEDPKSNKNSDPVPPAGERFDQPGPAKGGKQSKFE